MRADDMTVTEYANSLGVTREWIHQLIKADRMESISGRKPYKRSGMWWLPPDSFYEHLPVGRPRKS